MANPPIIPMGPVTIPTTRARRRRPAVQPMSREDALAETQRSIRAAFDPDLDTNLGVAAEPQSAPLVPEAGDEDDIDRPLSVEDVFGSDERQNLPIPLEGYAQVGSRRGPPRGVDQRAMERLWAGDREVPEDEPPPSAPPAGAARTVGTPSTVRTPPLSQGSPLAQAQRQGPPAEFAQRSMEMRQPEDETDMPLDWEPDVEPAEVDEIDQPVEQVSDEVLARNARAKTDQAALDRARRSQRNALIGRGVVGGVGALMSLIGGGDPGVSGAGMALMEGTQPLDEYRPVDELRQQFAQRDAAEREAAMQQEEMRLRNEDRIIRRTAEERAGAQAANQTRLLEAQLAQMQRQGAQAEREVQQEGVAAQATAQQYQALLARLSPDKRAQWEISPERWASMSAEAANDAYERLRESLGRRGGGGGGGGGGGRGGHRTGTPTDGPTNDTTDWQPPANADPRVLSFYNRSPLLRGGSISPAAAWAFANDAVFADTGSQRDAAMLGLGIGTRSGERAELDHDAETAVPGWVSTGEVRLSPQQADRARQENGVRQVIVQDVGRLMQIHRELSTMDRVEANMGRMNQLAAEAFQLQRELQAQLRAVYNFGVPTGDELQRIDAQVPRLDSIQAVLDGANRYRGLVSAINRGFSARFRAEYGLQWGGGR